MQLVEFVPPVKHPLWKLCLQMGITDVIVKVNPALTGLPDPWRYETLKQIVDGLKAEGLKVVGLEGDPFDMSPIKEFGSAAGGRDAGGSAANGRVVNGWDARCPREGAANGQDARCPREGEANGRDARWPRVMTCQAGPTGVSPVWAREEALAHYRELLESMAKLGIKLLCYNFMVGPGWSRTGVRPVRGGALATYFNKAEYEAKFRSTTGSTGVPPVECGGGAPAANGQDARCPREGAVNGQDARCPREGAANGQDARCPREDGLFLTKDQVWANYEYFIKAVMPTAEKCGVRMGLHPDDPCLPELGGYARIFGTVADYDRAYSIYPSPSNAVTYCQANFKLMGADLIETARHFGKRIAFIHVRDVEGDRTDFTELFHDQGTTDQFALMRTYRELGLDVPVRGDHVPEMEGDRLLAKDCVPGYFTMGRLFANGYLKALMQGCTI